MSALHLTGVDVGILVAIAVSALIGLARGLVREVLSLAVWTGATLAALAFSGRVSHVLETYIHHDQARFAASFAVVFLAALVAGAIALWLVGKLIETTGLSGVDRLLGFVFGAARGAVICIVAIIMLRPFSGDETWWRQSVLIAALTPFEKVVLELFDETAAVVRDLSGSY